MAVLPTDYTDSVTPTGATTEYPATTTRGLNATHTQINSNTTAIAAAATLTGAETLTNKTLDSPKITPTIYDSSGNAILQITATGSATNWMQIANAATGSGPYFQAAGSVDANVNVGFAPKGTGNWLYFQPSGHAELSVTGVDTNVNFNVIPQGTGVLQSNGNEVFTTASAIPAANIPSGITNGNTSTQSQLVVSATNYYIAGSNLNLPATLKSGMAVGTRFRWTVAMAKTAAGTGVFQISIYRGTNGSTADTQDVLQTIGTQTAAVDNMTVDVEMVVTTTGATGAYYWTIIPTNKAITATGFGVAAGPTGQFSGTVSSVAMNTASLKFGLGFKATTGTPTITVPLVRAQALNIS